MDLVERLAAELGPYGYNGFGVIARERYDAAAPAALGCATLHPPTRSIVVVATGGRAHWDAFVAWVAEDPVARLARTAHPLDVFTADRFARLGGLLDGSRVVFPTFDADVRLDFMRLGELAGLGRPSEIGILVGPAFGPWFALRAAVFTPERLPDGALVARACDGCPAPCRAENDPLRRRRACVVAPEAAYDPLQSVYHYDRRRGRHLLLERFGVDDEVPAHLVL
jgi:hypothetical protein